MTHPITPPLELVGQWSATIYQKTAEDDERDNYIATQAAQWGADQELEACCKWLVSEGWFKYEHEAVEDLRTARRPKPPSLKEQALNALEHILRHSQTDHGANTIRRALEQLDD